MTDNLAVACAGVAKLQLDEVSGEWVSKSELKKRINKRARKTAKAERPKDALTTVPTIQDTASKSAGPGDLFEQGFLAEVYEENPVKEVVTRFPPEPNGYLHLGHVKAMAVDFGFDDTNPSKEEEVYVKSILRDIAWLGFTPVKITYSSDYFTKLYELAIDLIKLDKAYVCHCSEADIKFQRGGEKGKEGPRFRCHHAEQSTHTNLHKFKDMHDGKYGPQEAFLRMKQDLQSGNPMMWDIAAYRIPSLENGRTHARAPEWKIFPTYDFAHCLCDSLEGITHSLCTTEFTLSRESYNWLNRTLGVYEPMQREFGRLNLEGTVLSKRALTELVDKKIVRGWDDPRLYTVCALRRRGVPPGALLAFVEELGVSTAQTTVTMAHFEQTARSYLETRVPRLMLVLDPLPVAILDLDEALEVDTPWIPNAPEEGSHTLHLTRNIYIDRSDFREESAEGYCRLAPRKTVGLLRAPFPIRAERIERDEATGRVTHVFARFEKNEKPKAYIHWVPRESKKAEVRVHEALFKSENPLKAEGGFWNDVNPHSEKIYLDAKIEEGFEELRSKTSGEDPVRFQALRMGYFVLDGDTTERKVVLNRIVSPKVNLGRD